MDHSGQWQAQPGFHSGTGTGNHRSEPVALLAKQSLLCNCSSGSRQNRWHSLPIGINEYRLRVGDWRPRRSPKVTTSARIKLTTSKTPIATWHGTASVGSSPPPKAHKSFNGYREGVLIRAARPRATRPHSARISRALAPTGGQLFVSRGGSFLASAEGRARFSYPDANTVRVNRVQNRKDAYR
jgi:hypothetical protein